jgi:sortase A
VSDVAESTANPGRVRKFDRPPPPHDWRWWVGGLGKTLIAAGLLMFGFVAYQLWGTGIETARAQNALENEFEDLLAGISAPDAPVVVDTVAGTTPETTPDVGSVVSVPGEPATTEPPPELPPVQEGDPLARIEMPTIGVNNIVVAGVDKSDLKSGPGHYPETPMPGQLGNAAIAGHRTTYGQPFFNVDKLDNGDEIVVTTLTGRYVYKVTGQKIVSPSEYQVIATTDPTKATLTLTSCHPKYTARERIIISADLDTAASTGPVSEPVINYGRPLDAPTSGDDIDPTNTVIAEAPANSTASTDLALTAGGDADDPTLDAEAGSAQVNSQIADAFSEGWFSDPGANGQVVLWGFALAAIGAVAYLISKKAKRDWVGLMAGIVPFMIVLYFFFQNVNRLLPPNL